MTWIVPTGYERREVVGCGYHWLAAASRTLEGTRQPHRFRQPGYSAIGEDGVMGRTAFFLWGRTRQDGAREKSFIAEQGKGENMWGGTGQEKLLRLW